MINEPITRVASSPIFLNFLGELAVLVARRVSLSYPSVTSASLLKYILTDIEV